MKNHLNSAILNTEVQQYIHANLNSDLHALLLKKSPFEGVSIQEIAQQIKGHKVAQKKFPFLLKEGIVFPPGLNLEQASSEATALWKAQELQGKTFADLTSGFGIDAYFLSEKFEEIVLVEQNPGLLEIVQHNWEILGRKASFINRNLQDFISENQSRFDVVYLDPARRDDALQKKFLLEDLSPNLLEIWNDLSAVSHQIMVKLSPLIDINYLISVLPGISEIDIIAVRNDVKELILKAGTEADSHGLRIRCVNLETHEPEFTFSYNDEKTVSASYSSVQNFLYIPNNAVLKAGAFQTLAATFNLQKLHPNTHFYTSDEKLTSFPGRILEVETIEARQIRSGEKFNIISKNHPLTPDQIRKKYKISDGGNRYLIFTQTQSGKIILKSK